ncbi:Dolichyl-diphosphooligosaccharide--protein glycosyltransferase subunit [Portunus trituberculatus]|uniref:Dolichyl-diphosphooligosaccharide--protein glycosyltransferase 48 kDa subunit n=1 Tax=Portunus trituberculatus TaxID=210409 RepID=A0A5B7ERW2_PORTR|nr:Dolichyl-diphosphooligosaccharide--protein glycosyltransferase subunit [Portunus trituberculatus]
MQYEWTLPSPPNTPALLDHIVTDVGDVTEVLVLGSVFLDERFGNVHRSHLRCHLRQTTREPPAIEQRSICVAAAAATNTLVLVDTLATRETHSIFLKSLQERGHELTVKVADDPSLQLSRYGEYLYQNLVIFAPGVEEFGGALSVETIVEFVDGGGNVLVAGSREAADLIRELVTEVGVEMDEEGAAVIDHLHYDANDDGQHTLIAAPSSGLIDSEVMVGARDAIPLLYRGTGLITDADNPLVLPVLRAPSTAYCYSPTQAITDYPHATGQNMLLVAALQARNNARVVVSGSLEFFSDAFIMASVQTPQVSWIAH